MYTFMSQTLSTGQIRRIKSMYAKQTQSCKKHNVDHSLKYHYASFYRPNGKKNSKFMLYYTISSIVFIILHDLKLKRIICRISA